MTTRGLRKGFGDAVCSYADVARSLAYFPLWLGQLVSTDGDTLHPANEVVAPRTVIGPSSFAATRATG